MFCYSACKIFAELHFNKFLFVFQAAKKFRQYWSIIFYVISIIMNTLSLLVMTMKHNRHLSTCVIMSVIAVNDNIVLSLNYHRWLVENTAFSIYTDVGCRIIIYIVHVFGSFGAFEIILMTLDKVVAIKLPHKSALLCTAKRAKVVSVVNFFTIAVFYLPNLDFSRSLGKGECARYVKEGWYVTVYSYMSILVSPVVPVAMLFVMNIIIIKTVWKSQKMRYINRTGQDKTKGTEVQLTIMLILVSSLFVILLLPFDIREIYYTIFSKAETPKQYAIFIFVFDVTYELYNVNYGINFYLYFVSGTKFRRDLLNLFGITFRQRRGTTGISISSIEARTESVTI